MWYEDLTECDYFGKIYSKFLTSIGWLKKGKPYSIGEVPQPVYEKLSKFNEKPISFGVFRGFHKCDLCENNDTKGNSNIFIPHNGKIYVCPQLITHYINVHHYLPPNEFMEAVLACPPQGSMEYLKKILVNGGRQLVKFMKENK